jgi:hypothetical protein
LLFHSVKIQRLTSRRSPRSDPSRASCAT